MKAEKAKCPTGSTIAQGTNGTSPTTSPVQSTEKTRQKDAHLLASGGVTDRMVFAVCALKQIMTIRFRTAFREMPLSWANGMCGVMPVFSTFQEAKDYAGDDASIIVLMVEAPTVQ